MNGVLRVISVFFLVFLSIPYASSAQGISVMPVNILMGPGQLAAAMTVGNQTDRDISFQIRAFAWRQNSMGDDQLSATDELLASPPIATIKPGASQVVRLILRRPP